MGGSPMVLAVSTKSAGAPAASAAKTDIVLAEQPRHPDREEIRLARVREVDRADPATVLLEQDARVLERAPRLAAIGPSAQCY